MRQLDSQRRNVHYEWGKAKAKSQTMQQKRTHSARGEGQTCSIEGLLYDAISTSSFLSPSLCAGSSIMPIAFGDRIVLCAKQSQAQSSEKIPLLQISFSDEDSMPQLSPITISIAGETLLFSSHRTALYNWNSTLRGGFLQRCYF